MALTATYHARAMSRDEAKYHQPEQFIPERFLREDGTAVRADDNPDIAVFGFGRR